MKEINNKNSNSHQDINIKTFIKKISKYRLLFIVSILTFMVLGLIYIGFSKPTYEISTSILIDPSGSNRILGESKYVEGGVSLMEIEKNLYNEIGIIKSYSLIEQTLKDLGMDVSYYEDKLVGKKESYGYLPFKVELERDKPQLYDVDFEVEILSREKYNVSIKAKKFQVSNPYNGSIREVDKNLDFTGEFAFGQAVINDYFNFTLIKPEYKINYDDFIGKPLFFIVHNPADLTNEYVTNLEVNNIDLQASIFKLVSYGPLPSKEIDFLKKLTDNYINNNLNSRNEIALDKESFIRNQLRVITDSLVKFEVNLEEFKSENSAVNLSSTANNALNQTQSLQVDRAKIQLTIRYYQSLLDYIETNRNTEDFSVPTSIGINNPLITENIIELTRLHAEKSRKKFFVTDTNEEMTILNERINESTEILLNNLRSAIRSSRLELGSVSGQISNYSGVITTLPSDEKQLLGIQRQSTLYENLFNYLSQELVKTGIARAESTSDTRVLDEARMIGDGPVAPQKMLIMVLAVVLGILFPLAWVIWFAPSDIIENVDQIKVNTNIPVISSIAHFISDSELPNSDLSQWNVKESFRDLTAKLKFVVTKQKSYVLGVTSTMPEEGKTFCTINLGIALAELGKRTLIIDTDLRNPSIVNEIHKIKGKGLSNYLKGEIRMLDEIIYPHKDVPNLKFIPTSIVDGNIHGLLSGEKMTSMIEELKQKFDYIILDTPAVGMVSDFILFKDVIDINLFIVRRNIAKLSYLRDFKQLIPSSKKNTSYIIFNDALNKDYRYGYGQKYGINNEPQLINKTLSV